MTFIQRDAAALLVVDIQERLMGAMPEDRRASLVRHATTLVDVATIMGLPTLVTEQYPKGLGATIEPITSRLQGGAAPVEKLAFSCGRSPEFKAALAATGRRDLIVCGVETHVCVLQTALDLAREGYRIHVPADAVTSRRMLDWERALAVMERAGVVVGTTELFTFQLLERAGTDEFKQVSRLVRDL